ncbi:MAG: glycine--tRNA ligase [Patescibacteria group bacterium]
MSATSLDQLVSLSKRRGFVFPGSEIYGGLANTWDYGPYGVELKNNIKKFWWDYWVTHRDDVVGVDASILMNPKVWEASGHVESFADPLVDCKACKKRHRGDKLLEEKLGIEEIAGIALADVTPRLVKEKINCPDCGKCDWAEAKQFNLMFKTQQGATEESEREIYMRPETAQGIFVNFKNVLGSARARLPFGIAQIGKAFRNEITPGNFTFRTREFEQMEVEYFCTEKDWERVYAELEKDCWDFFLQLGIEKKNMRWREHSKDELSHYSKLTKDIEYKFPWDWGELMGLAYRTDYDLVQHQKFSGESMEYTDPDSNEKFIPHCVEPSFGCDRTVLITLLDAYAEDEVNGEKRTVMKFAPQLAPIKVAVLPLSRKDNLTKAARKVHDLVRAEFRSEYDETQSIGKRYRRQDEIGTPLCVTVDFGTIGEDDGQSKKDHVTLRERDSLKQEEVKIDKLLDVVRKKLKS